MNICKTGSTIASLLLTLVLVVTPVSAQRRRAPAPKAPPQTAPVADPTFDTVLATESYRIYGEVRGVGQLLRSGGVSDILDPVMKLMGPPKEFKTLVRFLSSQADALMTSRLMFAAWPSRPKLPEALFVIEFASAEEARKFEPHLKEFLPKFLPTPVPESSPANSAGPKENADASQKPAPAPPPPYILKQAGTLVFIAPKPFSFKDLRPTGSKLLGEDQNFRQVHDRFNSESIFLYFDVASMEKEDQERMRRVEEEEKKRVESEAAGLRTSDDQEDAAANTVTPDSPPEEVPPPPPVVVEAPQAGSEATLKGAPAGEVTVELGTERSQVRAIAGTSSSGPMAFGILSSALFSGRPKWPEAFGVAIAFDAEGYVVRALLINSPGAKGVAIPFIPQLVSGPALLPEASSIMPADTELLVTMSLDYPLIYEGLLKAMTRDSEMTRRGPGPPVKYNQPESPFASYEAKLGIKIKEDLLPLLSNEVAVSIPVKSLGVTPSLSATASSPEPPREEGPAVTKETPAEPQPVMAIAIRDKEAVRTLLPKIIDSLGVKGASLLARTEKRDDTELVTYFNVISYAFIGNFLIVSPDAKSVRHVVDSYLSQQTLGSDSNFKNYTRWQPRQVLGQVYVAPALMDSFNEFYRQVNSNANEKLKDFVSRLNPTAEPLTYALSNEGLGPLHELHVPKNLVMLMIAGIAGETNQPPLARNEAIAQSALRVVASAEATYQSTTGNGNYGTLDQLLEQGLLQKDLLQNYGYKIEITAVGTKFEAIAIPVEYDKTGRMSFFLDESGVLRGGDHGGGAATVADKPLQ